MADSEEIQYLNLCQRILDEGSIRGDRTGVGTKSIFGVQMRYSLRDSFPLLTTKQVFWKSIIKELIWFIKGDTSAIHLREQNVKIWEGNSSRAYLDSIGLTDREVGDLGPVYGFQWRHFGAKYVDMHTNYDGQGVDQLANVINLIKNDPTNRRIIMSAWNPVDLNIMALPPCHLLSQFYVNNGELSCQLYQRSGDMGLGVPFNIASYSFLTYMIAHVCDLKPGDFVHTIGDAHIYLNHIDQLKVQIPRVPYEFPKITIKRKVTSIDDFTFDDFEIIDYKFHPKIVMDMAV